MHCETCVRWEDVRRVPHQGFVFDECPHCGAGEWDLFPIAGEFRTGDEVDMGSDRFAQLRDAAGEPYEGDEDDDDGSSS